MSKRKGGDKNPVIREKEKLHKRRMMEWQTLKRGNKALTPTLGFILAIMFLSNS